jgi:act minimal PKS acyl carrier protein
MADNVFTLEDLKRILRDAAGEDTDLDGGILDVPFDDLGYESLALLETSGRVEQEFGISLAENVIIDARTPRALIEAVNAHISAIAA